MMSKLIDLGWGGVMWPQFIRLYSSSWVNKRLHTGNQLPRLPGTALKLLALSKRRLLWGFNCIIKKAVLSRGRQEGDKLTPIYLFKYLLVWSKQCCKLKICLISCLEVPKKFLHCGVGSFLLSCHLQPVLRWSWAVTTLRTIFKWLAAYKRINCQQLIQIIFLKKQTNMMKIQRNVTFPFGIFCMFSYLLRMSDIWDGPATGYMYTVEQRHVEAMALCKNITNLSR